MGKRRPSMLDVARVAGVSHQTVSRVVNDPQSVSPSTLERVHEAIRITGYRRNLSARALKTARSETIGVIISGSSHFGPSAALSAIEEAARAAGFATQVSVAGGAAGSAGVDGGEFVGGGYGPIQHLIDQDVEGVIVVASQQSVSNAVRVARGSMPLVVIEADGSASAGVSVVSVDQCLGAQLATRHLLSEGYSDIAHIAGPADWFDARSRRRGWEGEMEKAGIRVRLPQVGDWSVESGYRIGVRMRDSLPQAVFVANDQMATGFLHALWEVGVRVPQDVAVVGFDDLEYSRFLCPSLSTVSQPFAGLGRLAVNKLVDLIGGGEPAEVSLSPRLMVRGSSKRA